jgi:hypothetical protein
MPSTLISPVANRRPLVNKTNRFFSPLGAQQPQAALLIAAKQKTKENMQALLCALTLIAVRDAYRRQEPIVPEPYKFQPFDLQAL